MKNKEIIALVIAILIIIGVIFGIVKLIGFLNNTKQSITASEFKEQMEKKEFSIHQKKILVQLQM